MKISERMTTDIVTVSATAKAIDAAKKMKSKNVGTVLVADNGHLRGILTDRQIATKLVAAGKDPSIVKVSDVMTRNPLTCSPDMDECEAAKIIGENGYRRLPVVDNERLVGIISVADLAEHAMTCNECMKNIFSEETKAER